MGYVYFDVTENQLVDSIPFSWADIEMHNVCLEFSWNNFTDIPPWNDNWILDALGIEGNKMTFEDIEPHFVGYSFFTYAPQQLMCEEIDTLLPLGSNYNIYSGTGGEYTNYEWYHNNQLIQQGSGLDTLFLENISYADTGIYYCDATNSLVNGLLLRRNSVFIGIDTGASINNSQIQNQYTIYPNPATDLLYVKARTSAKDYKAILYDLAGKAVSAKRMCVDQNTAKISMENLEPGIYLLRLENKNIINNYKIVKM